MKTGRKTLQRTYLIAWWRHNCVTSNVTKVYFVELKINIGRLHFVFRKNTHLCFDYNTGRFFILFVNQSIFSHFFSLTVYMYLTADWSSKLTYLLLIGIQRLEYFKQYTCTLFNLHLIHQMVLQNSHVPRQQFHLTFCNHKLWVLYSRIQLLKLDSQCKKEWVELSRV